MKQKILLLLILISMISIGQIYGQPALVWTKMSPPNAQYQDLWCKMDMSGDGTKMIAITVLGRLYISTNSGSIWNECHPQGDMDAFWSAASVSRDGSTMLAGRNWGRLYRSTDGGTTWYETNPAGPVDNKWYASAISADGSKMIAGAYNGRIYISGDYGATWEERHPADAVTAADHPWNAVAIKDDGTKMLALESEGKVYISNNSGTDWALTVPPGNATKFWNAAAMSSDGMTIIATSASIYISKDGGATWGKDPSLMATLGTFLTADISADGTKMLVSEIGGRIWYSGFPGGAWSELQPLGNTNQTWYAGAMSDNGLVMTAGLNGGRSYITTNGGTTWNYNRIETGSLRWKSVSISSDGTKVLAASFNGRIYFSSDGGSSFSEIQPAGDADMNWTTTAMSGDGTKMLAGMEGGNLFLSINGGSSWAPAGTLGIKKWKTTCISPNGSKMMAGADLGRLYISDDGGSTWQETRPHGADTDQYWSTISMNQTGSTILAAGKATSIFVSQNGGSTWAPAYVSKDWTASAVTPDGSKMIIMADYGRCYISIDNAASWQEVRPAGDYNMTWQTVSLSSDGMKIIAGCRSGISLLNGFLAYSTDGGTTWAETNTPELVTYNYSSSAMSADGSKTIAGVEGGGLYITSGLLPVELTSFNAKAADGCVELTWQTATEVNNFGFDVERKNAESGDGRSAWVKIGFVKGSGNSNSPKQYSYTDNEPAAGKIFYRLKQIDTDGKYKYYDAVSAEVSFSGKVSLAQNVPNPFNPATAIRFQIPFSAPVTVKIYDLLGREIASLMNEEKSAGSYIVYWNGRDSHGQDASSGVYFYKLTAGTFSETRKMNLLR